MNTLENHPLPHGANGNAPIGKSWNERLTTARKAMGLTMADLASKLELSGGAISQWESGGIAMLDADKMMRACVVLNISPTWLMFGDGELPPAQSHAQKVSAQSIAINKAGVFLRAARSAPSHDKAELIEAAIEVLSGASAK